MSAVKQAKDVMVHLVKHTEQGGEDVRGPQESPAPWSRVQESSKVGPARSQGPASLKEVASEGLSAEKHAWPKVVNQKHCTSFITLLA